MTPTVRRILLSQSLEKKVQSIVRTNGIAMYVPIPGVTCFQDSALTTPATVDSPVGGLKDYLGLYPATQATSGYRPILRGKVKNHLTYSEQVNSWALTNILAFGSGSITNAINDVDGNLTADFVCPNTSNVVHYVTPWTVDSIIGPSVCRIYCKAGGYSKLGVREQTTGSFEAAFNLSGAGTVIKITGTGASATIDAEVNGWYKITILFNPTTAAATLFRFYVLNDAYTNQSLNTYTYAADGTSGLYLSKGQISPGSSIETYINTNSVSLSSSYGPYWLDFDGVDDTLGAANWSNISPFGGNPSIAIFSGTHFGVADVDFIMWGESEAAGSRGVGCTGATLRTTSSSDYNANPAILGRTPFVLTEHMKNANSVDLRYNGSVYGSSTGVTTENTGSAKTLWLASRNGFSNKAKIAMTCAIASPVNLSVKDIYLLEKYAGKLVGITI